jgi:molybdate transport system substrate-binding protein
LKKLPGVLLSFWLPLIGGPAWCADAGKPAILVFVAASLTNVLQDLGDAFTKESSIPVKFTFAASSDLALRIENGAPADVFFSADADWMDYLQEHNEILRESRHDVLGNRLVLIAPADSAVKLKVAPGFKLLAALGRGRLASGDPVADPAGRYTLAALTRLGVWNDVSDRVIRADNVRSAMMFVERGEASLGVVYETDALVDMKVRVVGVFPDDSHEPIVYPIALTKAAKAGAAEFVAYIRSPAAGSAFKTSGFTLLH